MNSSTAATLALLAALVPASASATPFKDIYQEAAKTSCWSTDLCVLSFPKLPAGRHLEVGHLSCELIADKTRSHEYLRVRIAGGAGGDSIYQPLVFTAQTANKRFWTVDGNVGFAVPPGEAFDVVYGASGAGATWGHCVVSGVLVSDP